MKKNTLLFLLTLCLSLPVMGQQEDPQQEFPDAPLPPEVPGSLQSGQPIEPEVTIIQEKDRTIEEYRIDGKLHMVKIIPAAGKPYYLIDNDGDGNLETERRELTDPAIHQWILFSW